MTDLADRPHAFANDWAFLARIVRREIRREERKLDPAFVPAPGKKHAGLARIEHMTRIATVLEAHAAAFDRARELERTR